MNAHQQTADQTTETNWDAAASASAPVDTRSTVKGSMTNPRTLINVGVFTAIYIVITFGTAMLGVVNPVMMFVGWLLGLLLGGIVITLFLARTRAFGALTLLALLVGLFMAFTGHVWYTVVGTLIFGVIADAIGRSANYRPGTRTSLAYAVFSLWLAVPLFPIFYQADVYFEETATNMGAEYTEQMAALVTPWLIVAWAVVIFFFAWFSGWVGTRVLRKHFEKAGLA